MSDDIELKKLELEKERNQAAFQLKKEELQLKSKELEQSGNISLRMAGGLGGVIAALFAMIGVVLGNYWQSNSQMQTAVTNSETAIQTIIRENETKVELARQDAKARTDLEEKRLQHDIDLENLNLEIDLILKAVQTNKPAESIANLDFLVDTHLIKDNEIREGVATKVAELENAPERAPVFPSDSPAATTVSEAATNASLSATLRSFATTPGQLIKVGKVAQSVVRIRVGLGPAGYATGFLISPKLLLTADYVLTTPEAARNSNAQFYYQLNESGDLQTPASYALDPDVVFVSLSVPNAQGVGTAEGFTIIALGEPMDETANNTLPEPTTILSRSQLIRGDAIFLIHHPDANPKEIAPGQVLETQEHILTYVAPSSGGSGGAPILDLDWNVVGLHHRRNEDDPNKKVGIRISSIIRLLRSELPNLDPDERSILEEQLPFLTEE